MVPAGNSPNCLLICLHYFAAMQYPMYTLTTKRVVYSLCIEMYQRNPYIYVTPIQGTMKYHVSLILDDTEPPPYKSTLYSQTPCPSWVWGVS